MIYTIRERRRRHGAGGLDGLEGAVDVEASDQRRVLGVQDAHIARLQRGFVDSVEHDIDPVGQNLPLTPLFLAHILHHRVVQRAIQVLLPLALHLLHDLAPLGLRRLRLAPIPRPYRRKPLRQRVQRRVAAVQLVQAAVRRAVRPQHAVQEVHDPVHRRVLGVRLVVRHVLRGEEHHRGDALHVQLLAQLAHQRAVDAVEVHGRLHLPWKRGNGGTAKASAAFSTWMEKS